MGSDGRLESLPLYLHGRALPTMAKLALADGCFRNMFGEHLDQRAPHLANAMEKLSAVLKSAGFPLDLALVRSRFIGFSEDHAKFVASSRLFMRGLARMNARDYIGALRCLVHTQVISTSLPPSDSWAATLFFLRGAAFLASDAARQALDEGSTGSALGVVNALLSAILV